MNKRLFRITINGKVYEVEVEELTSTASSASYFSVNRSAVVSEVTPAPVSMPSVGAATQAPASMPTQAQPASQPSKREETREETKREEKLSVSVSEASGTPVNAPMPGKILRVAVKEGDAISQGDLLLVLEAMKMENEIFSPVSGVIKRVAVSPGDSVNTGDLLVLIG